ncbi:hypothetical protein LCGC14_2983360, partial [marine sediment metagenome]
MAWKAFRIRRGRFNKTVSITKSGSIVMNSACVRAHFPTDPKPEYHFIKFYSNEETKSIGIKPMQEDDGNC